MKNIVARIKNKINFKALSVGAFVLVLFAPGIFTLLAEATNLKFDVELGGYFIQYDKPEYTIDSFWNGTYQQAYTNWFSNNYSPRGIFIKTYNTILYDLDGTCVKIVGKDDYLFEPAYIESELCLTDENNLALRSSQEQMEEYVTKLEAISAALEAQGKHLILYITPSKADIYRDTIPDSFVLQSPSNCIRPIDYLTDILSDTNLNYINTLELQDQLTTPAFYPTGIHWSRPYEQISNAALLDMIGNLTGLNYRRLELTELQSSSEPYIRDQDLLEIINIWGTPSDITYYEYDVAPVIPDNYDQLNLLVQGGSFSHQFWRDIWESFPDSNIHYINYCEYMLNRNWEQTPIEDWSEVPIADYVSDSDCVVIELNEGVITRYSNGFVDALYDYLIGEES